MLAVLSGKHPAGRIVRGIEVPGYHFLNVRTSHPLETATVYDRIWASQTVSSQMVGEFDPD